MIRPIRDIALLLLLACPSNAQEPAPSYTAAELLVRPAPNAAQDLLEMLAQNGHAVVERDDVSGVLRVAVPAGREDELARRWTARADVVYAERNGLGEGGLIPNDSSFPAQWHLRNTGQAGGTVGADVRATDAWDLTTGSSAILVAVLDTGIDTDHPEFVGRIDPDGYDFVNNDNDPEADHPHGTRVSGVLGANGNNNFAVAGMDWQCRILPIKVLNANNGGTTFDLAQGLNYCSTQTDLQIVSMSLINYPSNATLNNALQTARNAGLVLLSCAGNGGPGNADISQPGASPLTISIGATTRFDSRAVFSGTGTALDFVAPGLDLVTVQHNTFANVTSTASGCSFATPLTAGIVSLAFARADALGVPRPTHDLVHLLLKAGAIDQVGPPGEDTPGRDNFFGHGRLDARLVLDAVPLLDSCAYGRVGAGMGGPYDVVAVNGLSRIELDRTIPVPANASATLSIATPPNLTPAGAVPGLFLLFARDGIAGTGAPVPLPFLNIGGEMCFAPSDPGVFAMFVGTAPWSLATPPLPTGFQATLQGLVIENDLADIAVTNLVAFDAAPFPTPVISALVPGAPAPGQLTIVTGANFLSGLDLTVGGGALPASSILSVADDRIEFLAPGTVPCDSTLVLTNPDGQTANTTYNESPTLTTVLPIGGTPAAGGTQLVLIGSNFMTGSTVTIGGNPMTITTQGAASIIGVLPPGNAGPAAIVITTPAGCTVTGSLTYTP